MGKIRSVKGRGVWLLALVGVALLFVVDSATATPGALDPSFGSGGIVATTLGSGGSQAGAVAVQPDGKILAGGETLVGSEEEFALARYGVDGTLDSSFGSGGKLTTAIGQSDLMYGLVLQPDGKIVAAGGSYDGSAHDFALVRYNPDGSLDTSFGGGGKVVTPIAASGGGEAYAIALQTDGKLVVGGSSHDGQDFVIVRYNPNGTLDGGFGTGGIVMTVAGYVRALAVQPDGKVVAAGGCCGSPSEVALARYNTDGSLDTSFGTGGIVTTSHATPGYGAGLVLQSDGKLVVGGEIDNTLGLLRFNTDGTLDTSFGAGGSVVTPIGGTYRASGHALVQQPDGDLVLAGQSRPVGAPADEFALARYSANGSQDAGFGTSGTVSTPIGATGSVGEALALESNGAIVVGGFTEPGANGSTDVQFALARYLVTSALAVSKDGNGSGLVTSSPSGIDCGATCTATFAQPVAVTLTATPTAGSTFTGWSGGSCSGTGGACQVLMSNDLSVKATFSLIPERLIVTKLGRGSGKVTSNPTGITCGYTCSHAYSYGTTVTLKASPSSGSTFKGWSGACSGTGTCRVTMQRARSATATFAAKPCIVPNVKGQSLKRARRNITRAHCRTGKISRRYSRVQPGHVVSQKPHPRRHLQGGAKIALVISKGTRP